MDKAHAGTTTIRNLLDKQKENNVELIGLVRRFWAGFHNSVIIALLFSLLGIGIGVRVAKDYYGQKLDEIVQTGAMLHGKKVFTVSPKL